MPTYHNPENALKRANEFCEVGKHEEALECLYYALKNRKGYRLMKEIHETIINKFLELCVELKKGHLAKDGLYNYRTLCQGINLNAWESAACKYLELAESKVQIAEKAFQCVLLDVDDLDQDVTPETLLKAVSNEGVQERTERVMLLPWVKFLWECHRQCLELLRNAQTRKLYYEVARKALNFCVKFSRRSELRKLCSILKIHAMHIQKRQSFLKTDENETVVAYLDTGFTELESAIKMELWQDAFKAIEDIHALINFPKMSKNSRIMARYYDKISCVFLKGEEYLFHAAANLRHFLLLKDQKKNLSLEEMVKLSSQVMLSVLAVPPVPVHPAIDLIAESDVNVINKKNQLLASLLELNKIPTRAFLIKEAIRVGVIHHLPKELDNLYQTMEVEIDKTFPSISSAVNFIQNQHTCELEQYIPLLQKVVVIKLLCILPTMYANIKMSKLVSLSGISDMFDLERIVLDSARRYEFPLRLDHKQMCVHFLSNFNVVPSEKMWDESVTNDSLPVSYSRCLIHAYATLKKAVALIYPENSKDKNKVIVEQIIPRYNSGKDASRRNFLQRKKIIEKYKENMENLRLRKEEDEKKLLAERLLQFEAAEKDRLQREAKERKLERLRREQEEIKLKILQEKMGTFKRSVLGSQISENLELDLDNLDPQVLFSKQIQQFNKERKELTSRLRRQERNFYHLERAKRLEELPLLNECYENQKILDLELWNEDNRKRIEMAHAKRRQELGKKGRFLDINENLRKFLKLVKKQGSESYKEEMMQFSKSLDDEKKKRLKGRADDRKQAKKAAWIEQQKLKIEKEKELKRQDLSNIELRTPSHRKSGQEIMSTTFPQNYPINVDETNFGEQLIHGNKTSSIYSDIKREKSDSEAIQLPRDLYYYKRPYKSHVKETERTQVYEQKTSVLPCNSYVKPKRESNISDFNTTHNNQRIRSNTFEKSDENLLTWRSPWSHRSQYRRPVEDVAPQRTVTVLRRDSRNKTPKFEKSNRESTLPKSEEEKSEAGQSCTPWAKLKRNTLD